MGSHAGAVPALEHGLLSLITPVKTRKTSHDPSPPGTAAAASGSRRPSSSSSSSGAGEAEEGVSAREDDSASRRSASWRHRQSPSAGSPVFAAAEGFVGREEGSRPAGAGTSAEKNPVPPEAVAAGGPQRTRHGVKPVDETRLQPSPPPPPIDAGHTGDSIDGSSGRATGESFSPASPGPDASPKESPKRGSSLAELDGFWRDGLLLRNKTS